MLFFIKYLENPKLKKSACPAYATRERFIMPTAVSIGLIHILGLGLAPFTYTRAGLILFLIMYCLTMLGITIGYHRLFTHHSFKATPIVKYLLALLAILSLQGGPTHWIATHRLHHAKVDKEGDPHSPVVNSFLWAHLWWNFFIHPELEKDEHFRHLAPDIFKDKGLIFLQNNFIQINLIFGFLVFVIGFIIGGWKLAISLLVWGGFLRIVLVWHLTWLVNSATHVWGYRNYDSPDRSQNNWWVALFSFGEGWHNNHHVNPQAACNQHRWFEMDIS